MHPILASALLALPLFSTATPLNSPRTTDCHSYILINTRGTGEPQGESAGFHTMIATILHSVPGGVSYNTRYLAAPDPTQYTTLAGSDDIISLIEQGTAACPAQEYALLGYSQGATVTNEVLQHFAPWSPEGQKIKGVVLIGNPYHLPNREGNVDEQCGFSTAGASGLGLGSEPYEIPDEWYASGKVRDICFTADQVCNGVNVRNIFSGSHLKYGSEESVQSCGASFVVGRLFDWEE
jgi:pimeloyl-ACP methyl ester carboxylesterase